MAKTVDLRIHVMSQSKVSSPPQANDDSLSEGDRERMYKVERAVENQRGKLYKGIPVYVITIYFSVSENLHLVVNNPFWGICDVRGNFS